MNYKEQMKAWISKHQNAKPDEAYEAGYLQAIKNWCHKEK